MKEWIDEMSVFVKSLTPRQLITVGLTTLHDPVWFFTRNVRGSSLENNFDLVILWAFLQIGSEGFFGPSTPDLLPFNPGAWASDTGQASEESVLSFKSVIIDVLLWSSSTNHKPPECCFSQDFVANNAPRSVDFASVHSWPDNWDLG